MTTVIYKPDRTVPPRSQWHTDLEARKAAQEYTYKPPHPYDRNGRSPIAYALAVLWLDGRKLVQRGEVYFLEGKAAQPMTLVQEANRILKRMGWPQIADSNAWLV